MCLPGAAQTVPLERFLGPEQLNAVNSQKIYCRVSPRGKFSAAAANDRRGGLGECLRAYYRAYTGVSPRTNSLTKKQ